MILSPHGLPGAACFGEEISPALGRGSVHGQNPDFEASDPAEMGFILGADEDAATQTTRGGRHGDYTAAPREVGR